MGSPLAIDDRFVAQCAVAIGSTYDTCGTITRSDINYLTVDMLEDMFKPGGKFADMRAWFMHSLEMRACGTRRNSFYDWIMANADREMWKAAVGSGIQGVKTHSLMHPFVLGSQKSVVNKQYFKITCGAPQSGYTTNATLACSNGTSMSGNLSAGELALGAADDRVFRIESRYGVPLDTGDFRARDVIHHFTGQSGLAKHGAWKVLASHPTADNTSIDVLVTSENAGSSELYDLTPTNGVIIKGINNVHDYESWCHNKSNIDPRKQVPFWFQTYRMTRCVDELYREVYETLMTTNDAWKQFGDIPLTERNMQDEADEQDRFVNAFLFQKPLPNQTLTGWTSLEDIVTVTGSNINPGGLSGKVMAKRANWIGVKEQLRLCGRVIDLANQPLNLHEFFRLNNAIYRARDGDGKRVIAIDWHTSEFYRAQFQTGMMAYYKDMYGDLLRFTQTINQKNDKLGIVWDSYRVKYPASVEINIVSHHFFDDWKDQFVDQGLDSVGNLLLSLDIGKPGPQGGTIYYAHLASNRKVYTTAQLEQLAKIDPTFRCTMEYISQEQTLQSETGMPIVSCPLHSSWLENLADAPPVITAEVAPYDDLV